MGRGADRATRAKARTAIAERLFDDFVSPLVIGGALRPGKPIGARDALALGQQELSDVDRVAHVELARVRTARKLVPVDRFGPLDASEWALAATLHDVVQATHPDLRGAFRRSTPLRLIELAETTLARIPAPASVREALSRHTLFARMFEIVRTDSTVSWWVGSQTFLGVDPPARLQAWPELRRVHVTEKATPLAELPLTGAIDVDRFGHAIFAFLVCTPLTDLATCDRELPRFTWTEASIALVGTRAGRTLVQRALALRAGRDEAIDAALGRGARSLFMQHAWPAVQVMLPLLAERALIAAERKIAEDRTTLATELATMDQDAAFGRGAGAWLAEQWITSGRSSVRGGDRTRLLDALAYRSRSPAARDARAALEALTKRALTFARDSPIDPAR